LKKIDREFRTRPPVCQPDAGEQFVRPYRSACELLADLVPKIDRKLRQTRPEPKAVPKIYLGGPI